MTTFTQEEAFAATVAPAARSESSSAFRELWDDERARARLIQYRRAIRIRLYSDWTAATLAVLQNRARRLAQADQ